MKLKYCVSYDKENVGACKIVGASDRKLKSFARIFILENGYRMFQVRIKLLPLGKGTLCAMGTNDQGYETLFKQCQGHTEKKPENRVLDKGSRKYPTGEVILSRTTRKKDELIADSGFK